MGKSGGTMPPPPVPVNRDVGAGIGAVRLAVGERRRRGAPAAGIGPHPARLTGLDRALSIGRCNKVLYPDMTEAMRNSRVAAELERLERALDRVEAALVARDARAAAELEALRRAAAEGADGVDDEAVRAVTSRVDRVIERLEAVLGG